MKKQVPMLQPITLTTSRMLDFFSEKELTAQTGHPKRDWPLVALKELLDNSIDAAEDVGIAPQIAIKVDKDGITVTDNGPGLLPTTVEGVLDFSVRVSSREHYVCPTRGAQGNALKTLIAMPFVLDGKAGRVDIIAKGVHHEILVTVDRIKQEPKIEHQRHKVRQFVKNGTSVKIHWPDSASSILGAAKERFAQIADDFTFLNPHLSLTLNWHGAQGMVEATKSNWKKWLPSNPTSPHWYSADRLDRLLAGYISDDEAKGRDRTVREFISGFDGLTGSAKQKTVLDAIGMARLNLSGLRNGNGLDSDKVTAILKAMQSTTRPVRPAALGIVGRDHLAERFETVGANMETFKYRKAAGVMDAIPWVIETAFGWCPNAEEQRLITGVNWSPGIINPFRELGKSGHGLGAVLEQQRAGSDAPIVFLMHFACARVEYTDRGKSAVVIDGAIEEDDEQ